MNIFGTGRRLTRLLERVQSVPQRIDEEAGVIYGVKVLGKVSENGREYSDKAMDQAAKLYEGAKVNIDHDRGNSERGFVEGIGDLRNVRREGDAIYADLHYLKSHPYAGLLVEAAQRFPGQFGLSHDAQGEVSTRRGKAVVESVTVVHSVDLVGRPATNAGLFESVSTEKPSMKTTIRALVESQANGTYTARLREMDGAYMDTMNAPVEMPVEEMGEEDAVGAAFAQLVMAVLNDTSLDLASKKKKIGDILSAQDKLMNGDTAQAADPAAVPEEDMTAKDKVAESLDRLTKQIAQQQLRNECRELMADAGVQCTTERLTALVEAKDDTARVALVKSWPTGGTSVAKPRVSLREDTSGRITDYVPGQTLKNLGR